MLLRDQVDEEVDAGGAVRAPAAGAAGAARAALLSSGERPAPGLEQVHQADPDQHRDHGDHDGIGEGLEADAAEPAQIAETGDPERQSRDSHGADQRRRL